MLIPGVGCLRPMQVGDRPHMKLLHPVGKSCASPHSPRDSTRARGHTTPFLTKSLSWARPPTAFVVAAWGRARAVEARQVNQGQQCRPQMASARASSRRLHGKRRWTPEPRTGAQSQASP
jgi:hypothetical protein